MPKNKRWKNLKPFDNDDDDDAVHQPDVRPHHLQDQKNFPLKFHLEPNNIKKF